LRRHKLRDLILLGRLVVQSLVFNWLWSWSIQHHIST